MWPWVKKEAYISNNVQHQSHSITFLLKNKSLSTSSVLSRRSNLMAYNTTASRDKLTCTDYRDFRKRESRFRQFSWSKKDSNYLVVKLNVQERWHQRLSPGPNSYNGRDRLQPNCTIEESAGDCKQKTSVERKTCTQCWYQQWQKRRWTFQNGSW